MRRKSLTGAACPIARTLDVIGDWWSLLIVRDAMRGRTRFGEIQRSLGVSKNILTRRLKELVGHGVLELVPAADGSAYQEYRLTERGRGLWPVIVALSQWGNEEMPRSGPRQMLVDKEKGEPVGKLELRARDGRLLKPGDTMMARIDA